MSNNEINTHIRKKVLKKVIRPTAATTDRRPKIRIEYKNI